MITPSSCNFRISFTPGRISPSSTTSRQTAEGTMIDEKHRRRSIRPIWERWMSGEELLTVTIHRHCRWRGLLRYNGAESSRSPSNSSHCQRVMPASAAAFPEERTPRPYSARATLAFSILSEENLEEDGVPGRYPAGQ